MIRGSKLFHTKCTVVLQNVSPSNIPTSKFFQNSAPRKIELAIARTLGTLNDVIITYNVEYRSSTLITSG